MGSSTPTTIGAISEVFDGPHATPKKLSHGPYFLSISSLENGKLDLSKSAHLSDIDFAKWTRRVTPREGDVLFSYETRLGEAALMPPNVEACLGRRMGLLRPKVDKVFPKYLLLAYLGPQFQREITSRTISGCTVDRIALRELPSFPISIPSMEDQKAIAHILGSLDDKIELNRQINQTLESMAQALFKSWFVDFDPVIDNALAADNPIPEALQARAAIRQAAAAPSKGDQSAVTSLPDELRQQFPSEFEFTEELGWVPKGWEVVGMATLCDRVQSGGTPKRSVADYWFPEDIPWLTSGEVKQQIVTTCKNKISHKGLDNSSAKWLPAGASVVAMYGATAGEISFLSSDLTTNQAVCGLVPKVGYRIYNYLTLLNNSGELARSATGSAQQNINKGIIESLRVISPTSEVALEFEDALSATFDRRVSSLLEAQKLADVRDTLLPKLISGELRIPDAEKLVAEADL
jgi:type I restriction enzyme S subunit